MYRNCFCSVDLTTDYLHYERSRVHSYRYLDTELCFSVFHIAIRHLPVWKSGSRDEGVNWSLWFFIIFKKYDRYLSNPIPQKFYSCFSNGAADVPVKFQNDMVMLKPNLAASRHSRNPDQATGETYCIVIRIFLKFVPVKRKSLVVQAMTLHRTTNDY